MRDELVAGAEVLVACYLKGGVAGLPDVVDSAPAEVEARSDAVAEADREFVLAGAVAEVLRDQGLGGEAEVGFEHAALGSGGGEGEGGAIGVGGERLRRAELRGGEGGRESGCEEKAGEIEPDPHENVDTGHCCRTSNEVLAPMVERRRETPKTSLHTHSLHPYS